MMTLLKSLFRKSAPTLSRKVHNLWEHQIGWGHNVYFSDWDRRRITGHHPSRWDWKVGDEVRAKMASGKIGRFRITEFEPATGVWDMFFLTVEDVGYLGEA